MKGKKPKNDSDIVKIAYHAKKGVVRGLTVIGLQILLHASFSDML